MHESHASSPAGSTALLFLAPPGSGDDDDAFDDEGTGRAAAPSHGRGTRAPHRPMAGPAGAADGGLRMLKAAREAAHGMNISDEQIRATLDDPQDVEPDPNNATRTRFRRDGVVVTAGQDGMILRVARKR